MSALLSDSSINEEEKLEIEAIYGGMLVLNFFKSINTIGNNSFDVMLNDFLKTTPNNTFNIIYDRIEASIYNKKNNTYKSSSKQFNISDLTSNIFVKLQDENIKRYGYKNCCNDYCCNVNVFNKKFIETLKKYFINHDFKKKFVEPLDVYDANKNSQNINKLNIKTINKLLHKRNKLTTNAIYHKPFGNENIQSVNITGKTISERKIHTQVPKKKKCSICNTTKTPVWRKYKNRYVCNACGLYHKYEK